MTTAFHAYQAALEPARQQLTQRSELRALLADDAEPTQVLAFLVQWASMSIQLHEPAEHFLAEASRRCAEHGESKLALTLLHIAVDAIDVYRLLADDARTLAQLWNRRALPQLELTRLLTQPANATVHRCHELHRELALGPEPWAELAAVYEVQAVLAAIAEPVLSQAERLLGDEIRPSLCTLRTLARHGDSSLTQATARFLDANPARLDSTIAAGRKMLELYAEFLHDCWISGLHLANRAGASQPHAVAVR